MSGTDLGKEFDRQLNEGRPKGGLFWGALIGVGLTALEIFNSYVRDPVEGMMGDGFVGDRVVNMDQPINWALLVGVAAAVHRLSHDRDFLLEREKARTQEAEGFEPAGPFPE